ncbi:MAG: hypothetical protein V4706_14990 [Pseudomonadota bacterium]
MAADRQIHKETPFPWLDEGLKTPTGTSGKAADGQLSWFHYAPEAGQTQSCGARKNETSLQRITPAPQTLLAPGWSPVDLYEFFETFSVFEYPSHGAKPRHWLRMGSKISITFSTPVSECSA